LAAVSGAAAGATLAAGSGVALAVEVSTGKAALSCPSWTEEASAFPIPLINSCRTEQGEARTLKYFHSLH